MPTQGRRTVTATGRNPEIFDAIKALVPNANFSCGETWESVRWNVVPENKPTEEQVNAKLAELTAAHEAEKYKIERFDKYPKLEAQLALLWDDMDAGIIPGKETSSWYASIKSVKDSVAKPS